MQAGVRAANCCDSAATGTLRENLRIKAYIAQRFTSADNDARRQTLIDDWLAGLRQRGDVIDLYATAR